jgi:putative MATE family efflux protein
MRLDRWRAEVGEVWTLAWPMVVLGLVRASYLVADTWWVGHLGADALTAVSASAFAWWIAHYLCELPATGVHARTAQVVGAGHPERIGALVADGALLGLIVASLVGVGVWWGAPSYFGWMGLEGEVGLLGRAYLHTLGAGGVCFVAHGLIGAVFRGVGDMRTALVITTLGGVLNAALDPLLIWGVGPIPALGVAGAGWATVISSAVAAALGVGIAWRRGLLTGGAPRRAGELGRLATIGAPISAMGVGFSLVYVALGGIVVPYGEAHMAALGVGHRIESFPFLTAVGFATAATTLVGQRFGAGDAIGAQRAAAVTAAMCGLVMTACSVVGLVAAEPILRAFSEEPEIVVAGIVYLRLQALVWGLMGLEVVYEGAFTGAGRTLPVMWISSALTAARIPLAWLLAGPLEQGVVGIWIAIALSTALKGLALTSWFHGASWQVGVAPGDEHGA